MENFPTHQERHIGVSQLIVKLSINNYCTLKILVQLFPPFGTPFRGVMLQGRVLADDTTPAGTFIVTDPNTQLSSCSPPEVATKLLLQPFYNYYV